MSEALDAIVAALKAAGVTVRPLGPDEPRGVWTRLRPLFDVDGIEIEGVVRGDVPADAEIAFCDSGGLTCADWTARPGRPAADVPSLVAGGVRCVLSQSRVADEGVPRRPRGLRQGEERGHLEGRADWFRRRRS